MADEENLNSSWICFEAQHGAVQQCFRRVSDFFQMACVVAHTKTAVRQAALRRSRQEHRNTMVLKLSTTGMALMKASTP